MEKFTLEDLRDVSYGEFLSDADVGFANELLKQGHDRGYVRNLAASWAHQYWYESECETQDAARFQKWAYGND